MIFCINIINAKAEKKWLDKSSKPLKEYKREKKVQQSIKVETFQREPIKSYING